MEGLQPRLDRIDFGTDVGHIDDEVTLGRKEPLTIHLDYAVTLLLEELQKPAVEIVAVLGNVALDQPSRDDEAGTGDMLAAQLCFDVVKDRQPIQEVCFL